MSDDRQHRAPPAGEAHVKRPGHEGSEPLGRRDPHDPRSVGRQGHRDLERGLEDTDRRGGDDYQRRTQNDAHANRNAGEDDAGETGSDGRR